jgi:hypothetical protein
MKPLATIPALSEQSSPTMDPVDSPILKAPSLRSFHASVMVRQDIYAGQKLIEVKFENYPKKKFR